MESEKLLRQLKDLEGICHSLNMEGMVERFLKKYLKKALDKSLQNCLQKIGGKCLEKPGKNENFNELITVLLQTDIDISIYGEFALVIACSLGDLDNVIRLVDAGVKPEEMNLYSACTHNHPEIVKFLIKHNVNITDFTRVRICTQGPTEIMKTLLESGVTFNQLCLKSACLNEQIEIVKLLLSDPQQDICLDKGIQECQNDKIRALIKEEKIRRLNLVKSSSKKN